MKVGCKLSGFTLKRIAAVAEMRADIYEFEHDSTGARLAYLAREDSNMTFAVSFATPPKDDTGVCHIIEHSVLCGSEKYPLKDPFAELLKGSLNTFLNAMTYEDKTVYPVSSRCEKDFLNLVDVYLDAVLRPNLLKNPNIFRQEGWHYEYDGERLTRSGVVYNEMKGAYSSPDDIAMQELSRTLFGGSVYECDSGGDPNAIPTLTYEALIAFYKKYYHPSNAKIFLDGTMDIERVLTLIDSHLSSFERTDISVVYDKTADSECERTVSYEISEEETGDRARVLFGYVYSDFDDAVEQLKTTVLCDYLCGSNASALKRELLSRSLANDVSMYTNRTREQTVVIEVRDTAEEKIPEIKSVVNETIARIAKEGLDKSALHATLDLIEFKLRERDYGGLARGIGFALTALGAWLYGENPESALMYESTLASVREEIENGGFESTLLKMTLENSHKGTLIMLPDKTLTKRRAENEERELREILAAMTASELEKIKREHEELLAWQRSEETDEAMASLPTLSISDIPEKTDNVPREVKKVLGRETIFHDINTEGIVYANLFFDISDVKTDELYLVSVMSAALTNLNTEKSSALELQNKIKGGLGSFKVSVATAEKNGRVIPYVRVTTSALLSKTDKLCELLSEVLCSSDFDNEREIENILLQSKASYEDDVLSSGHRIAIERTEAYTSAKGAVAEHLSGYEAYTQIKRLSADKSLISELKNKLGKVYKDTFTRDRLTLSVTGERNEELAERIIGIFPEKAMGESATYAPLGIRREFFLVPSKVGYAGLGCVNQLDSRIFGELCVARSILSYEYIWNKVRVEGGAYGGGFSPRRSGYVGFYSYRDPSPARSLGVYAGAADYLRALAESKVDIERFIIGAMGEYDPLTTPKNAAALSSWYYLNGVSDEQLSLERASLLSANSDSLIRVASLIEKIADGASVCIVGGKEHLASCEKNIENVLTL
ncbi:MAG: insulinase family protein [Clostridia bacterium]|nr:insulinase family protein [Clostridia bacterium]